MKENNALYHDIIKIILWNELQWNIERLERKWNSNLHQISPIDELSQIFSRYIDDGKF